MAQIMDPILPILSVLRSWAIILGSFGGPGPSKMGARGPKTPLFEACFKPERPRVRGC